MDGFEARFKRAVHVSEAFYAALARHPRVTVERIANGTNVARVTFDGVTVTALAARLAEHGIRIPAAGGPAGGPATVTLGVNESWNRLTAAELVRAFEQALG